MVQGAVYRLKLRIILLNFCADNARVSIHGEIIIVFSMLYIPINLLY